MEVLNTEIKLTQFGDDTTLLCTNILSVERACLITNIW